MQLTALALLLSILCGRTLSQSWPHLRPDQGIWGGLAIVLLFSAAARLAMAYSAATLALGDRPQTVWSRASQWRQLILWCWILSSPWLLASTGWGATVDHCAWSFGTMESSLFGVACWSLPSLLFLAFADFSWFEFERHMGINQTSFFRFWWNQVKHTWFLVFAPSFILCGLFDWIQPGASEEWSIGFRATLYATAILVGVVLFPEFLAWSWNAGPMAPGDIQLRIEKVWRQLDGRSKIQTWSTSMRVCNAIVLGILPWRRRLLLSDLLLCRLSMPQIEMILCHEAAHIHRGHFLFRAVPFVVSLTALCGLRFLYETNMDLKAWTDTHSGWLLLLAVGKLGVVLWSSSKIARWTEKDADRFAVELAERYGLGVTDENASVEAMQPSQVLVTALEASCPKSQRRRATWLYPSVEDRCRALQAS